MSNAVLKNSVIFTFVLVLK